MRKFNDRTDNEFSYIKLTEVNVFVKTQRIEVMLIYPESKKREVYENNLRIIAGIKEVIDSKATVDVILTMSHFDLEFFKKNFVEYFKKFPSVSAIVSVDNLSSKFEDGVHYVTLKVDEEALKYMKEKEVDKGLENLIENNYCENVVLSYEPIVHNYNEDYISQDDFDSAPQLILETPEEGRYITPENVEEFLGNVIYDKASYISDCNKQVDSIVLCGTISEWQELRRKPKNEGEEGRPFFKFTISDFTGNIKCLIFPRNGTYEKISMLKNGKTVVVKGSVQENTFRGETTFDIFVKDLSLCTLPENFTENKYIRVVEENYKHVFPRPFFERKQVDLFSAEEKPIPQKLKDNVYVVFDLEATSKYPDSAKIIEIAAFKMINGVICEAFTTFINPQIIIPEDITELTSITNEDVKDAPTIAEALPDFYKFVEGTILVGHNISTYDIPLLNAEGESLHIRFYNEYEDTLSMARKYVKGIKKHGLKIVTEYFGIVNEHAHRADSDTLANAKLFLKLCELQENA